MKIATSILNVNFNNLEEEIRKLSTSDYFHLDVMDGHFVPNISFGYPVLKNLKKISKIPLDTHLMIENPYDFIDDFEKIGTEYITVHIEAKEPLKTIQHIKNKGIKAGISLKPNTSVEDLFPVLDLVDLVLVMTVEPGFGGQSFMVNQIEKIKTLNNLRKTLGYNYLIEVDGGINNETINYIKDIGVDIVVSGTYITQSKDPKKAIKSLK